MTASERGGPPRYHDLDALRAFAMLLGVVLHALLWFIPDAWPIQEPWAYSSPVETNAYAYLLSAIHGFRMPVFFLLGGFFTAMLRQRRGWRGLAAHRLRRVGLPFLVGCFAIIPLNAWVMSRGKMELAHLPWAWVDSLHHLWFLWALMILVGVFIVAARVGAVFSSRLWWAAIPLTLLPQMLMAEPIFGPDTSDGIVPDPVVLGYYALFFGFGSFCHQQRIVVSKRWAATLPFTLLPVFFAGLIVTYEVPGAWGRILSAVLQVSYAWLMCFGLMGLFRWIAGAERQWVRYVSDASYWIYLWHLPLVVGGQWLMLGWPVNPHLKFLALCLAVPGMLLVVYELGVRYTPVGAMLNGRRTRIELPATGAASGP